MKTYPNKQRYQEILKRMSAQGRLEKSFELTALANTAFKAGLKSRYPRLSDEELDQLYLTRLRAYHDQNY